MAFAHLLKGLSENDQKLANFFWENRREYFSWPVYNLLLWKGCIVNKEHNYPKYMIKMFRAFKVGVDRKSNGPARMSFLMAGGCINYTCGGGIWEIHHIYDGQHPRAEGRRVTRAVNDGRYFTEAAGLVACHPLAHKAAHVFAYVALNLRYESYKRFGFNPDHIF